jgi:hypothetical protein
VREHEVAVVPHCCAIWDGAPGAEPTQLPGPSGPRQFSTVLVCEAPPSGSADHVRFVVVTMQTRCAGLRDEHIRVVTVALVL